jgi:hypothetical protein
VRRSLAPVIPACVRSGCWRVRHCPEKACAVITLPPSLPAQAFALLDHTAAGRVSLASQHTDGPGNDVQAANHPQPEPVMAVPFPVMSLPSHSASRAPRSQTRPAAQRVYPCIAAACGNARSCRIPAGAGLPRFGDALSCGRRFVVPAVTPVAGHGGEGDPAGTSTRTIRIPSGSSICVSVSPHGSATVLRRDQGFRPRPAGRARREHPGPGSRSSPAVWAGRPRARGP